MPHSPDPGAAETRIPAAAGGEVRARSRLGTRLLPALGLALVTGCSPLRTVRVLDGEGEPLPGALVLSEQGPFISQDWAFCAALSGPDGRARTLSGSPVYWKPGHHPCDFHGLADPHLPWPFDPQDPDGPVVLHRRTGAHPVVPEVLAGRVVALPGVGEFELPVPFGLGFRAWYDPRRVRVRARATHGALVGSASFYFAGPEDGYPVPELVARRRVAFYVLDALGAARRKVAISIDADGSTMNLEGEQVPTHDFYVAWAATEGRAHRIEPAGSELDEIRLPLGDLTSGFRELGDLDVYLRGGTRELLLERIEAAREIAPDAFVVTWLRAVSAAPE